MDEDMRLEDMRTKTECHPTPSSRSHQEKDMEMPQRKRYRNLKMKRWSRQHDPVVSIKDTGHRLQLFSH